MISTNKLVQGGMKCMGDGRTKKTLRNTFFSLLYKLSDVVLAFVLRTIFIYTLGISYLGLSGLFTNILTVLSLMELGVGSAIVFSLYKPLATGDYAKVASLMQLYKRTYNIIGVLVCLIGFLLTPFLEYIIKLPNDVSNLNIIYWLTIANTGVSYFLAYRRSLLMADQRSDINSKNLILFRIIRFVVLSIALIVTHNFIIYLALDVLTTLVSNIHITYVIKKFYTFLEGVKPEPLDKEEKRNIIKYMASAIFSKIGQTVVNSTDNIIISAFISTIFVGIYSNYNMVIAGFDTLIYLLFSNITASVGNYAVTEGKDESETLFKKINLANYILVFCVTVCIYSLLTPFVSLWVGQNYILDDLTVSVIVFNFYLTANQNCVSNFMGAVGELYYINRYRSMIEATVNLVVSILLVKFTNLGITGVFLGTTVCFLCGRIWMDARTLYKHWFKKPFMAYIKTYVFRLGLFIITSIVCKYIVNQIYAMIELNIFTWIMTGVVCLMISVFVLAGIYGKTEEFQYYIGIIKNMKSRLSQKNKE